MNRAERFSKNNLEQNFFLMTSFLMSNLFDFVCYGIGLTNVSWKKFMPALIFSILVSDAPFVASGYALKQLGNIERRAATGKQLGHIERCAATGTVGPYRTLCSP